MESVNIPSSIRNIENSAFSSCTSLKSVIVPKSVKYIGEKALGYESWYGTLNDFKIYGYAKSEAQYYAEENEIEFVEIDDNDYTTTAVTTTTAPATTTAVTTTTAPVTTTAVTTTTPPVTTTEETTTLSRHIKIDSTNIYVSDEEQIVDIPVSVEGNVGFAAVKFKFELDGNMQIVGVEDGLLKNVEINKDTLAWFSSSARDMKLDGVLFTLKVSVPANTKEGDYNIKLISTSDDFATENYQSYIPSKITNSVVNVSIFVPKPGDLTGDGEITVKDLVIMKQIALGEFIELDIKAILPIIDLNGDGKFSAVDLVVMIIILIET